MTWEASKKSWNAGRERSTILLLFWDSFASNLPRYVEKEILTEEVEPKQPAFIPDYLPIHVQ